MIEDDAEDIPCPFCEGRLSFTDIAALHSIPPCDEFIAADDALAFVVEARRRLQRAQA